MGMFQQYRSNNNECNALVDKKKDMKTMFQPYRSSNNECNSFLSSRISTSISFNSIGAKTMNVTEKLRS